MNYKREREPPDSVPKKTKWPSPIYPVDLEENPAAGRGEFTTVSVLEPSIRVERSSGTDAAPHGTYRIIATFNLEISIMGFNRGCAPQAYNRFLLLSQGC